MNILFVSPKYNPFNGVGWGAVQRTNLLFEACLKLGHVDLAVFQDGVVPTKQNCEVVWSQSDVNHKDTESRFRKLWRLLFPFRPYIVFPKNPYISGIVANIIDSPQKNYDLIVCRYIPDAMQCGLLDYADRLVIDVDDNPVDIDRTNAQISRTRRNRMYHLIRSYYLERIVMDIQNKCHFTFYTNRGQARYKNSAYLPNVPFYDFEIQCVDFSTTSPRILFVGNMSYGPNCDGVDHFIKEVFSLVRQQIPNAELHLVGGCNMEEYISRWQEIKGVEFLGFVEDLSTVYTAARVAIVPIYSGAGTNIKTLEAMQAHRPCVTTQYGLRGYENYFCNGKHVLVAGSDVEFADHVVSLLSNQDRNHNLANEAYQVLNKHFTRDVFNSIVCRYLAK